jgi:hypothetical protein
MRLPGSLRLYRLLLGNEWRVSWRAVKSQQGWFVWLVLGLLGLYLCFTLVVLGLFFPIFARHLNLQAAPVAVLHQHLFSVFFGLFLIRFLFQKSPQVRLLPYLHLPIPASTLVRFFQGNSLLSLHNYYPLCFFLPFWAEHILGVYPTAGALAWLAGVGLCLLASNYANLLARAVMTRSEGHFLLMLAYLGIVMVVDQVAYVRLFPFVSSYVFNNLLLSPLLVLSLLVALLLWLALTSARLMRARLHLPVVTAPLLRKQVLHLPWLHRLGASGRLVELELKLIWRNRRPRHYLIISLLFSTLYLVMLMLSPGMEQSVFLGGLIGLFASGGFALNYGQLMFSWESSYFDGLLARDFSARQLVRAKLWFLQGSCLALFVLSTPLFLWLRPELLPLHVAFLGYNTGITCLLVLLLALSNRHRVDIARSGGFFNYEGFSAWHWLWFIPTALPPTLLLYLIREQPERAAWMLGSIGVGSLLLSPLWHTLFSHAFARRRYAMAQGFRGYDG